MTITTHSWSCKTPTNWWDRWFHRTCADPENGCSGMRPHRGPYGRGDAGLLPAGGRHPALACTQSLSGSCSLWSARVLGVLLGRGADRRCRRPIEGQNGQHRRDQGSGKAAIDHLAGYAPHSPWAAGCGDSRQCRHNHECEGKLKENQVDHGHPLTRSRVPLM